MRNLIGVTVTGVTLSNVTPVTACNTSDIFLRKRKRFGSQASGKGRVGMRHYCQALYKLSSRASDLLVNT